MSTYNLDFRSIDSDEADILAAALPTLPGGGGRLEFGASDVDGTQRLFLMNDATREVHTFVFTEAYTSMGKWMYENECNDRRCGRHFHATEYAETCPECNDAAIQDHETASSTIAEGLR